MNKLIFILLLISGATFGQAYDSVAIKRENRFVGHFSGSDSVLQHRSIFFSKDGVIGVDTSSVMMYREYKPPIPIGTLDTLRVFMLVCDTTHRVRVYRELLSCKEVGCKDSTDQEHQYITHLKEVKEDLGMLSKEAVYSIVGYSVRERRRWSGQSGYADFWLHKEYLNADKKPLNQNIVVWQTKGGENE